MFITCVSMRIEGMVDSFVECIPSIYASTNEEVVEIGSVCACRLIPPPLPVTIFLKAM